MTEKDLLSKAKKYLKDHYGEDTVSMDVTGNDVSEKGDGIFSVDCTVRVGSEESDWSKKFHFKAGNVVRMDWRMR